MTDSLYDPGALHYPTASEQHPRHELPEPSAGPIIPALSTLDELRAAVAEVAEVADQEFPDHVLYSPGEVIRLTCSTDLDQAEWKQMQIASMPKQFRNKRIPDPRKVNEIEAFCSLIGRQTVEVAIRQSDGSYRAMDGTFQDPQLLAAFGVAEPQAAVRKVFAGRDAYVLHAGQELVDACGFGERRPGESGDPT